MPGFVGEPTHFHGSLLAETPARDDELKYLSERRFPNDHLATLETQAEDRLIAFSRAWQTLRWLPSRAQLLRALWWDVKLSHEAEALLTLALCDGWSLTEIAGLDWADVDLKNEHAMMGGERRPLLPRTAGLLDRIRKNENGPVWSDPSRETIVEAMRQGWNALVSSFRARERRAHPQWELALSKIDR